MIYKNIIEKMTLEEKASLCVGRDYWNTKEIDRLNIPSIRMSDGPHGLRVQETAKDNLGVNESKTAVCFPACSTLANSWNKEMAYDLGNTLGEEAKCENVQIVLGPAINIKRSPLCGRNFEYFSEDPVLTGVMAKEYVKGLQKNNVGACLKHFAVNNQENRRMTINAVIDERALREIYLKAFEIIVKEANPYSVMSAYNKVNGKYCTENKILLDILKKEWNFEGIVITDWGAENNRVDGLIAGNEIEMPGERGNGKEEIIKAVNSGKVSEEYLDEIVDRILKVAFKLQKSEKIEKIDFEKHHKVAEKIAEESIVLLKNDENILPLIKSNKIALIGDMSVNPRYQGAGSSTINPYKIENIYECLKQKNIEFVYSKGYNRIECENDLELKKEAVEIAKENDTVILCVGLTENYESEGMDRTSLEMPKNQNELINEICKVNKNVIIILSNGSPVLMPWKNDVKAIITGYLGGEAGASAMVNCLIGKVNPSGKLAETYPLKLEDTPCYRNYPGSELSVEYKESIYVGYRYYDKNNINVLFPFGYGLSYTSFEYSALSINENKEEIEISFKIKNVGKVKGKEIAQIYIQSVNSNIFKPLKELKAFEKIELKPNEEKNITIMLKKENFSFYNVKTKKWEIENGLYKILIGKSVQDIVLEGKISIESKFNIKKTSYPKCYETGKVQNISDEDFEKILGSKIPQRILKIKDITEENTLEQIRNTKVGNVIYKNQIEKMNILLEEQNVNKATKVMMNLQKPLKKFYEKNGSKFTKEMVDELIYIAKNDLDYENCKFLKLYIEKK